MPTEEEYLSWKEVEGYAKSAKEGIETIKETKEEIDVVVEEIEEILGEDIPGFGGEPAPAGAAVGGRWATVTWTAADQERLGERKHGPITEYKGTPITDIYLEPTETWGGIPVTDYPSWIPLAQGGTGTPYVINSNLTKVWRSLGLTDSDVINMKAADPMLGVAAVGTPFSQLNPLQQRGYLANSHAINLLKNSLRPEKYIANVASLKDRETDLGFCDMPSDPECGSVEATIDGQRKFTLTGRPVRILFWDVDEAFARLQRAVRGLPEEALSMEGAPPGAGAVQTAPWQTCLTQPKAQMAECLEQYKGQPGVSELLDAVHHPWMMAYDASKAGPVEMVMGGDKKRYLVFKIGSMEPFALSIRLAIGLGIGWSGLVLIAAGGGAYWLYKTKGGKAFRKRIFG